MPDEEVYQRLNQIKKIIIEALENGAGLTMCTTAMVEIAADLIAQMPAEYQARALSLMVLLLNRRFAENSFADGNMVH